MVMASVKLFAWLSYGEAGELVEHRFIKLHEDHSVTWDGNKKRTGKWRYAYHNGCGYMFIEFTANPHKGCGTWKRHCLDQVAEESFELRPKEDDCYSQDIWWGSLSEVHRCKCKLIMKLIAVVEEQEEI